MDKPNLPATPLQTPFLTPSVITILAVKRETDLTDDQFRELAAYDALRLPPEPMADEAYVRSVVGSLSGLLKMPKIGEQQAKLQVGLYLKALAGSITRGALDYAATRALKETKWLPEPSVLMDYAKDYRWPEREAKEAARALVRQRNGRLRMEIFRQLEARTYPVEKFGELEDIIRDKAVEHRVLFYTLDNVLAYRTADAVQADYRARAEFTRKARAVEPE